MLEIITHSLGEKKGGGRRWFRGWLTPHVPFSGTDGTLRTGFTIFTQIQDGSADAKRCSRKKVLSIHSFLEQFWVFSPLRRGADGRFGQASSRSRLWHQVGALTRSSHTAALCHPVQLQPPARTFLTLKQISPWIRVNKAGTRTPTLRSLERQVQQNKRQDTGKGSAGNSLRYPNSSISRVRKIV